MPSPNFTMRAWLAFDPPSSTSPTWVEITSYVQQESPINITHGRPDGLSDVSATTCSLTVDNTDGRFLSANKSGPWYGQIDKGNWLKVEITPPSGTVSQRFVGFITSLPDTFAGDTQYGQITASDRFEKLSGAPALISSIQHEVLTDPNIVGSGSIQGYWNLHESQGSLTFGDTSGQGARHLLAAAAGGVPVGTGFAAGNVAGPGFDGTSACSFVPPSQTTGTYLTAPITSPSTGTFNLGTGAYSGLYGTLEFWFQVPIQVIAPNFQVLAAVVDPVTNFGSLVLVDRHDLVVAPGGTNFTNQAGYGMSFASYPFVVDDGKWHHVIAGVAATNGGGGWVSIVAIVDGVWCSTSVQNGASIGTTSGNFTQLMVGGGFNGNASPGVVYVGEANIAEVSWYWSDLQNQVPASGRPPDALSHYKAGANGFVGESTDARIARVARYSNFPKPATTLSADSFNAVPPTTPSTLGQVQSYSPVKTPWLNLSPGAHSVSTQSIAGRKPLDVMQEAAHTENMPLYMDRSGYLTMQPSTTRQNTSPAWTVTAQDLDSSTRVADDFAYTTNQMTITPNTAAAQTVIGATGSPGRLSQAKYDVKDGSQATASVNPIEAQSLGLGIIQLRANPPPRLAPVAFEASTLALLPGYGNAWYDAVLATEISTPARVASAPAGVGGGNYDFLIEGWTEAITAGSHQFAFGVSAVQGPTYQLDDVLLGRLDTDGSTLVGALNTSATTFTVATTSATGAAWTTSSADFPFDILMDAEQMTVTSIAPVSIGVDGTFEASATGWTLSNCTLAQSTAQAHSGTHSGLMTASAAGAMTATTPQFAVLAGATYQVNEWFLLGAGAPTAATYQVQWFTSGGASLGTVTPPFSVKPVSSWQLLQQAVTAPATAAFATVRIGATAAAAGNTVYFDDVSFPLLTGGQQPFTVTRSVNGVVASHLAGASLALAEPLTLAY